MSTMPDVIRTYIAAYNQKDVAGMIGCLSDDVAFRNISAGVVMAEATSREAFEEMAKFEHLHFKQDIKRSPTRSL